MPKQKGLIKVKGTMGDLSFYRSRGQYYARQKGGVDGERIKSDPAFIRTRENGKEFAQSAAAGKLLRNTLRPLMVKASDSRVVSRITKIMSAIKNLDGVSLRGERTVGVGFSDPKAKLLLKGFDFNDRAGLATVLKKGYLVNTATGNIDIPVFSPDIDLEPPVGATHVAFRGGWAQIDFGSGTSEFYETNVVNVAITPGAQAIKLTPIGTPSVGGVNLFLLKMEFFQEINGAQYSLRNGAYNALGIIEVI